MTSSLLPGVTPGPMLANAAWRRVHVRVEGAGGEPELMEDPARRTGRPHPLARPRTRLPPRAPGAQRSVRLLGACRLGTRSPPRPSAWRGRSGPRSPCPRASPRVGPSWAPGCLAPGGRGKSCPWRVIPGRPTTGSPRGDDRSSPAPRLELSRKVLHGNFARSPGSRRSCGTRRPGPARLPDVGLAGRQAMVEAKPDRRVDLIAAQVRRLDPCDRGGFVGALELAADRAGPQADVDRLSDLLDLVALVVGDQVVRRGEHAHDAGDLDLEAGLLLALADGGLGHGFALLHGARGDGPQPRVGPLQQKHPAGVVPHQHGGGRLAAGRLRRVRVLPVVDPAPLRAHASSMAGSAASGRAEDQTRSKLST